MCVTIHSLYIIVYSIFLRNNFVARANTVRPYRYSIRLFYINFYRPTYTNVKVRVTIKKLQGYTDAYVDAIKEAISTYITEMGLAETIYNSIIWSVAVEAMDSKNYPAYSVTNVEFSTNGGSSWSSNDVTQLYYGAATCAVSDVTVNVSE